MNGFEKWFSKATQRFEKALLKLGVLMLLLLFISQFLLTNETIRNILSPMDRLEGDLIEPVFQPEFSDIHQGLHIVMELDGEGQGLVKVLVNKVEAAAFEDKRVVLEVKEGDMIEIDGQEVEALVTVTIVSVQGGIKAPRVGHSVTAFGTNELLGWVTVE